MIWAILQSPVVRLMPVGAVLIALQKTLFVELPVSGVVIQVVLAFAAAAGAAEGAERGALTGFVLGIMFDLAVGTPLGSAALSMSLAGTAAGASGLIRIELTWWLGVVFAVFGAAVGELSTPVLRAFVGRDDQLTNDVFIVVPVVALAAGVLSIVFVPVARLLFRKRDGGWKVST